MTDIHEAQRVLREVFRLEDFIPGQAEVMLSLLGGRSAAAVFPTGGGKSLCYQLPALLLPGLTLVVSPLIALMKDQIDQLRDLGIAAARLDSSLSLEEHRQVMTDVRSGDLKLLYVAPERFNNERFREVVAGISLSMFAVDEAHCISEWGHNFRPDYLKLAEFAQRHGAERILALTATATPKVLEDICQAFRIAPVDAVCSGFYRGNLTLLTTPVSSEDRDRTVLQKMNERLPGPAIVYVTLQKTAVRVAEFLSAGGIKAQFYHAGMKAVDRSRVQDWFLTSPDGVVVATIAFGMGIDKSDIRTVLHYNHPKSLENLAQEIGRAGRDGLPSNCEVLICPDDLTVLRNFAYGDTPSAESVRALVGFLCQQPERFEVSLYDLSRRFDIRILVVRTLLTYLELQDHIEEGTARFTSYRFRFLVDRQTVVERFNSDRQKFLNQLFDSAIEKKVWFDIDLDDAARNIGGPRERLVRALDYLADQGDLELRAAGVHHRFSWRNRPGDLEGVASVLSQRLADHETREIERLNQVLEFGAHDGCQSNFLCHHFGEERSDPCGHCSFCRSGQPAVLLEGQAAAVGDEVWQELVEVRAQYPDVLSAPRSLARFAVGLTSPVLTRARLSSHILFGVLADVPFPVLLELAKME